MGLYYLGTPDSDIVKTRAFTLQPLPDGGYFEDGDIYEGLGGNDIFHVVPSRVDEPDLLETSSAIYGNEGDDSLFFRPSRDFLGQVDVQFSGGTGNDVARLDFSKLGPLDVDFTDLSPQSYTAIIELKHADNAYAGQFFLQADIERIDITGSAFSDRMIGNAGDDRLDGGAGNDVYFETEGSDTYIFDSSLDHVARFDQLGFRVPDGGTDTIWATASVDLRNQFGIENLRLSGTQAIDGTGNALANLITGNSADNVIAGGLGKDSLYGKGGSDAFLFAEKGAANKDSIWDFGDGDSILLDQAVFAGLQTGPGGALSAASYALNKATSMDATVVYNVNTGILSFDADGNGAGAAEDIAFISKRLTFFDQQDVFVV